MGMAATTFYMADMVRAIPDDGQRYETVHGELLVTPALRAWHQEIAFRVAVALWECCGRWGIGHVMMAPADISWSPDTLVQPDVFVVDLAEARTLDWRQMQHLLLAMEVLSPSSALADRFTKRRLYQEVGIPVYWLIDPDASQFEVWTPEDAFPTVEQEHVTWLPEGAGEEFVVEMAELFRAI